MTTDWLLAIIPMILLFSISVIVSSHCRSWIHPGAYFPLVTTLYFLLPLIFATDTYIWPAAMWWILVSMLAFLSGSMLLTYKYGSKSIKNKYAGLPNVNIHSDQVKENALGIHRFPGLRPVLIFSIVLGIFSSILLLIVYGRSISVYLSLEGIAGVGSEASALRYSGEYHNTLPFVALLTFVNVSPILGGILMALRENKKQLALSLLSFLPAILGFLTTAMRAGILTTFILFISAYFACHVLSGRASDHRLFPRKRLLLSLALVLISLIVFSLGQMWRRGDIPTISGITKDIRSPVAIVYLFGHAPAFSQWLKTAWSENEEITFGASTFQGVCKMLGIMGKVNANPEDEIYIAGDKKTNIYSVFRRFAEDFSFAGSLLFLFLFGLLASIVYTKVGEGSLMLMPLLIAVYAFMGMQLTPIFRWSSVVAAFLVIQAYFIAIRLLQRSNRNIKAKVISS